MYIFIKSTSFSNSFDGHLFQINTNWMLWNSTEVAMAHWDANSCVVWRDFKTSGVPRGACRLPQGRLLDAAKHPVDILVSSSEIIPNNYLPQLFKKLLLSLNLAPKSSIAFKWPGAKGLNSCRVHFRIAPLNNQIALLWGVGPALGNTDLNHSRIILITHRKFHQNQSSRLGGVRWNITDIRNIYIRYKD